jgi:hypothetical protein
MDNMQSIARNSSFQCDDAHVASDPCVGSMIPCSFVRIFPHHAACTQVMVDGKPVKLGLWDTAGARFQLKEYSALTIFHRVAYI